MNFDNVINEAHIFRSPLTLWEVAALAASFSNREWYWLDDHTSVFTN